jgi:hypothetical protein
MSRTYTEESDSLNWFTPCLSAKFLKVYEEIYIQLNIFSIEVTFPTQTPFLILSPLILAYIFLFIYFSLYFDKNNQISLYKFILADCIGNYKLIETLLNLFLEPTSTKQWM